MSKVGTPPNDSVTGAGSLWNRHRPGASLLKGKGRL
jgi:hypothetical protein